MSDCLSVRRSSVCIEQLDSHWMDFYEILHSEVFGKSVEKIQVSLKSDKNEHEYEHLFTFMTCRSVLL